MVAAFLEHTLNVVNEAQIVRAVNKTHSHSRRFYKLKEEYHKGK